MTTIFGIKNCDTVKKARRWLDSENIDYTFHDFRSDGLTLEQLEQWVTELGLDKLINKRSTTWKALSETEKSDLMNNSANTLILEQPTLIKRPLLATNKQCYVGFSEATYRTIFLSQTV